MTALVLAASSALWLGIVTSISPCPLATNVAAVSSLSRQVGNRRRVLLGAGAYTLGRVSIYLVLAMLLFVGLASMPQLSSWLRREALPLVGPILICAGMALLGWLPLPIDLKLASPEAARKLSGWGVASDFMLGALFALSFCPLSAALFFGSLIPLALPSDSPPLVVSMYGVGTALPVGLVAILLAISSEKTAKALGRIQDVQKLATMLTCVVLIAVGVYLTFNHILLPRMR